MRSRARVEGVVQGVGFRPFVHRLAGELALDGFVLNDERGVLVEVQGSPERVERFLARLRTDAPPLAIVERVLAEPVEPSPERGFRIVESTGGGRADALVSADVATCEDCLAELFDPADRRYRYPFLNCTNCGPRFTIVRGVPYDRANTTMAALRDVRARAAPSTTTRPTAASTPSRPPARRAGRGCRAPALGRRAAGRRAVAALLAGAVVAVKGLGGYHLACRADDERAVGALRARKHREDKPFALMVARPRGGRRARRAGAGRGGAAGLARAADRARARGWPGRRVAAAVAPRSRELGVMLPYTPLHHLLLADARRAAGDDQRQRLRRADRLRGRGGGRAAGRHRRGVPPARPADPHAHGRLGGARGGGPAADAAPLARLRAGGPRAARARRGGRSSPPARELKSTFCVARGSRAWVSHHIGDLANLETLQLVHRGHRALRAAVRGRRPR